MSSPPKHIFKGTTVSGTVSAIRDEGTYVELEDGVSAFIEVDDAAHGGTDGRRLSVGDLIDVVLLDHCDPHAGLVKAAIHRQR